MAVTTVYTYPLDGSKKDFSVPFEYLARKFVAVTLVGSAGRKLLVLNTDYRFTSKTAIQTTQAWGAGSGYTTIEVKRNTSATDRLVSFADGSILRATDMNLSQVQTLHVAEEARNAVSDTISVNSDGMLDARGRRVVNLQSAKDGTDAVTYQQVLEWSDSALNSANAAKSARDQAERLLSLSTASQSATKTSEDNAATYRDQARTAKDQAATSATGSANSANSAATAASGAKTSETNSKASETNAAASAANALTQANRAKTEADKLGNANAFMATLDTVTDTYVSWKPAYEIRVAAFRAGGNYLTGNGLSSDGGGTVKVDGAVLVGFNGLNVFQINTDGTGHFWVRSSTGADRGVIFNVSDGSWYFRCKSQKQVCFANDGQSYFQGELWANLGGTNYKIIHSGRNVNMGPELVSTNTPSLAGATSSHYAAASARITNGGNSSAAAAIAFHREGSFAAYFGLDVDNQWAVGGWSMGTRRFVLWHEGNLNPSEYVRFDNLRQELGGRSAGEIGTYGMFQTVDGYNRNPGDLIGGGGLRWGSHNSVSGSSPTGTWRCCGYGNQGGVTLWLRVN